MFRPASCWSRRDGGSVSSGGGSVSTAVLLGQADCESVSAGGIDSSKTAEPERRRVAGDVRARREGNRKWSSDILLFLLFRHAIASAAFFRSATSDRSPANHFTVVTMHLYEKESRSVCP